MSFMLYVEKICNGFLIKGSALNKPGSPLYSGESLYCADAQAVAVAFQKLLTENTSPSMYERIESLEDAVEYATENGNPKLSPYACGKANGLLFALSIMKNTLYKPITRPVDRNTSDSC